MSPTLPVYLIAALSIAGIILRPFKMPEAVFALGGAVLLVLFRLLPLNSAVDGILKGADVYFFLTGMMLLSEAAREEGLFDWLASHAIAFSRGSPLRLFVLVYLAGSVVTVFMSNDATAIVLTPAVAAAVSAANVPRPLPYLYICAFIANAASFVLPISNPANLVIYGGHMPPLPAWLSTFLLPSLVSVVLTFFMLLLTQKKQLRFSQQAGPLTQKLSIAGKVALWGIIITTIALIIISASDMPLGLPTAIAGILTAGVVSFSAKKNPLGLLRGISWSVIPLVAGLFVIVEALAHIGIIQLLSGAIGKSAAGAPLKTAWLSGTATALGSNLINNLPAGLIVANTIAVDHLPTVIKGSALIGIDLGPNLSVTGSLATILWLIELRRQKIKVSAWEFLKIGAVVMVPALISALAVLLLAG